MDASAERAGEKPTGLIGRLRDKTAANGVSGAMTAALNRLLRKGAAIDLVHVLLLEGEVLAAPTDASLEMRFLTSDEVRRYAAEPESELPPALAGRIDHGLDFCFAALSGDRLASYSWLALGSVEAEHAAGVDLGLPAHMAYLYKAFTLPGFRGRRLYAATTAGAAKQLRETGITQLVAFVYWNNASALRACARMGYRRLGMLMSRPSGPVHVPSEARRRGILFGAEARPSLAAGSRTGTARRREGPSERRRARA